jgi:tRNA-Thr(GGU) m(6)t(6)A37 methyltransferase TsaA
MSTFKHEEAYQIYPIGKVSVSSEIGAEIEIRETFRPALKQLEKFSHVTVVWWADQADNEEYRNLMQMEPPYAKSHVTGVFASRSPARPNPIATTTARLLNVDEETGIVRLAYIDAFEGTPVIDLKAYFPTSDRVREPQIPEWLSDWPEWLIEAEDFAKPEVQAFMQKFAVE